MLHFRADAPSMDKIQQKYPPVTTESGVALIVVAVIMPIIATVWTVLRIWTRRIRGLSPFLTEDVLCYLGLVRSPSSFTPRARRIWLSVSANKECVDIFLGPRN